MDSGSDLNHPCQQEGFQLEQVETQRKSTWNTWIILPSGQSYFYWHYVSYLPYDLPYYSSLDLQVIKYYISWRNSNFWFKISSLSLSLPYFLILPLFMHSIICNFFLVLLNSSGFFYHWLIFFSHYQIFSFCLFFDYMYPKSIYRINNMDEKSYNHQFFNQPVIS